MKTAFQLAALAWIIALSTGSMSVLAENKPPEVLNEVTLDIDNDGKMDRAVLAGAALYVYLAAGDEKLDLSRKPAFLKKDLTSGLILGFEAKGKGSLIVKYGCGGCSNDYATTLTIVHRGGEFLLAGFTYDWDTRNDGIGSCDINFLAGKGVTSRGLGARSKPINAKFAPVKLADWSDDKRPKACDF